MGDCGSGCSTKVENFSSGSDVDVTHTTNDGSSDLGSEWVPDSVLDLVASDFIVNGDSLLIVD